MKTLIRIWLLLLVCVPMRAQFHAKGVVRDESGNPLAFATVRFGNSWEMTDLDGSFFIASDQKIPEITVSYTGYSTRTLAVSEPFLSVLLVPDTRYKPASARGSDLMRNVIARKKQNDPWQKLASFRVGAYSKMVLTANPDSISGRIDSIYLLKKRKMTLLRVDSSDYDFKRYISRQHLFLTEKVSDYQFSKGRLKENITGVKMGGFSQPVYELMALRLLSLNLYDDRYELLETTYNSPLADDALLDYNFRLLDTMAIDGRAVAAVQFYSTKRRYDSKLQGLLYVDLQNFAVAKAVFRYRGVINVSAAYDFAYFPENGLWFVSETELQVQKGRNDRNISILGETLEFDPETKPGRNRPRVASDFIFLKSATWFGTPQFNPDISIRHVAVSSEITDAAITRSETYWDQVRKNGNDARDRKTYHALDSISGKRGIEWKLRWAQRFLQGYVPVGPVDIRLNSLVNYNNYEGLRIGIGGVTNRSFSKKYRLEGYGAYGFRDEKIKYSLGGAVRLGKFSNSWIGISYADDVREVASTVFATDRSKIRIYDARPLNVSTFYTHRSWRGYIETRLIPKTESIWQITHSNIYPQFEYAFLNDGRPFDRYQLTTGQVSIQWNPRSRYMQTPAGRIEIEKRFPKFAFQFTQSFADFLDSDFTFGKLDLRVEYEKNYLSGQKTSALLMAGYAYGDAPITQLYNTFPNRPIKGNVWERIRPQGSNSFETMLFNEFFSSKYVMLQFRQTSQRINISRKIRPTFGFVTRMAYGEMENRDNHLSLPFKTLDKGFYESGIEIGRIYSVLGLSGFYRYGENRLPNFEDNFSIKVSFTLSLGI